jgi:hypothetical protein
MESQMTNLAESLAFVKSQGAYHVKQSSRRDIPSGKAERHEAIAERFGELAQELEFMAEDGPSGDGAASVELVIPRQLRLGDLSDLPASLRAELNISAADQSEQQIIEVIRDFEGVAAVDEILVGLWRKYKVETKRRPLGSKLYRMTRKDMIHSVPKRRGLYSLTPIDGA